jgi:Tfp pilus assembly protein PilP
MKMKPAITITTTILVSVLAGGLASAQSPSAIQTTRDKVNTVKVKDAAASHDALGVRPPAPAAASAKPAAAQSSRIAVAPGKVPAASAKHTGAAKPVAAVVAKHSAPPKATVTASKGSAPKGSASKGSAPKGNPPAAAVAASNGASGSGQGEAAVREEQVKPTNKNSANGRRDPFISPVVSHLGGSGCSTGKKCLEIGAINLRGVVHAESGFIAVVSNSLNKAYFLRENDPVFNGYVVKITGDSIVFQETVQDRLGKTFTREVVKKITTPAV